MSNFLTYFCSFNLETDDYDTVIKDEPNPTKAAIQYATREGYHPYNEPVIVYVWEAQLFNPSTLVDFKSVFDNSLEDYESGLEDSWISHWEGKATPKAFKELETYFQMYFKKWMRKYNFPSWYTFIGDPTIITIPTSEINP